MDQTFINWMLGWLFDPFVENPQTTNAHRAPMKFSIKPGLSGEVD